MLFGVVLEYLFGEEVLDLGLVGQHLPVGGLEKLGAAVVELLADVLLHAWIAEVALAGRILTDELEETPEG